MDATLREKHAALVRILLDCGSVCIDYTGDVNSVYLARTALNVLGPRNTLAVTARPSTQPAALLEAAAERARRFGIPHTQTDLPRPDDAGDGRPEARPPASNPWAHLFVLAASKGLHCVLNAYTVDDDVSGDRAGRAAAQRLGVRSPLREAGLDGAEVRELSRRVGLPADDEPGTADARSRPGEGG